MARFLFILAKGVVLGRWFTIDSTVRKEASEDFKSLEKLPQNCHISMPGVYLNCCCEIFR